MEYGVTQYYKHSESTGSGRQQCRLQVTEEQALASNFRTYDSTPNVCVHLQIFVKIRTMKIVVVAALTAALAEANVDGKFVER